MTAIIGTLFPILHYDYLGDMSLVCGCCFLIGMNLCLCNDQCRLFGQPVNGQVKTFNIAIFVDTVTKCNCDKCPVLHTGIFNHWALPCGAHFQWPWLHFIVIQRQTNAKIQRWGKFTKYLSDPDQVFFVWCLCMFSVHLCQDWFCCFWIICVWWLACWVKNRRQIVICF